MNEKKNTITEMCGRLELEQCRDEARKACQAGNNELADVWSRAAEAAQYLIHARSFSGKLHDLEVIPLAPSSKILAEGTQLSTTYLLRSTQAFQKNNFSLANEQIIASTSIKKAAECYYQWALDAHEEMLERYSFQEDQQEAAALQYRYYQAEAARLGKQALSQQWAEAACLAQESLTKAKKTKTLFSQIGDSPLSYAWMIASFWTYRASVLRAAAAEGMSKGDQKNQLHVIAFCAEQASSYRAKAAKALSAANPLLSRYWTSAAFWSGNASRYLQQQFFQSLPAWQASADEALRTADAYVKAAKSSMTWYHPLAYQRYWTQHASRLEKKLRLKIAALIFSLENQTPLFKS